MPLLIKSTDPFDLSKRTVERVPKNRKISAMCPKSNSPIVCIYNGRPLMRAGWNRRIKFGDTVAFIAMPRGSSSFTQMLAIAVVAVVAVYVSPLVAGHLGFAAGSFGAAMVSVGLSLVTSMLLNAVMPPPKLPTHLGMSEMSAPSPTYSIAAQGNMARLEQPIPVHYGRHLAYPDFAAKPYQEFQDNEQYLHQLLVIGQGVYQIEQIRIEDTPISNFEGAQVEIIEPGQKVTLFPAAVIQSNEIGGAEILGVQGPFVASGPEEESTFIGIDLICPNGLYYSNDSGGLDSKSVQVQIEYQRVDNFGVPFGTWGTLAVETISGGTNTAIRRSYKYAVAKGRYQVKVSRLDSKDTRARAAHAVHWLGLRAYLPDDLDYGNITLIAVKLKATAQISEQATRKINVIATRKLPTWNSTTGWSAPVATRSIAWALADICRASYGANLSDDRYDLVGLSQLATVWDGRGDTFDARFDGKLTVGEALTSTARVGRAKWFQQSGRVMFWRDSPQTVPSYIFTPRNIVAGSFSLEYVPAVADTSDGVRMTYFDERYWQQREAVCVLPGSAGAKLTEVKAFGMVNRDRVVREGMKMVADNKWRRKFVKFESELDGWLVRFGHLIGISHDVPKWGQSGDIVYWDEANLTAELSEKPEWGIGNHYIRLTRANGSPTGTIRVTQHPTNEYCIVLQTSPGFAVEWSGMTRERTRYVFGVADKICVNAIVTAVKPKGRMTAEIEAIVDDPRVHDAETNTIPDDTTSGYPTVLSAPIVSGLVVTEAGTIGNPQQIMSWQPANGATHYIVQYTLDDINWVAAGDTPSPRWTLEGIPPGAYFNVRVAAMGLLRGPWVYFNSVSGSTIMAPGAITDLSLINPFTGLDCRIQWSPVKRADRYRVRVYAGGAMRREQIIRDTAFSYSIADAGQDGGPWRTLEFRVLPLGISAGDTEATISATNAQIGQLNNVQVISDAQGALWSCSPPGDVDLVGFKVWASKTSGFQLTIGNLKYDGTSPIRQLPLEPNRTWYVRCAAYDVYGDDNLNVSGEFVVTTGAVGASHISVTSLSAIIANLGEIIAGKMRSADNTVDFDLDAKRLLVRDAGGAERVKLGVLDTGKYGLRVSDPASGKTATITPSIGIIVAQGTATMPTYLNADGTYELAITLPGTFNFSDLTVIVDADDVPAYDLWGAYATVNGGVSGMWGSLGGGSYRERDNVNAAGRPTYKAHTVSAGLTQNVIVSTYMVTRWNKGYASSGNTIYIQGSKNMQIYDHPAGWVKNLIDIGWPITLTYTVIAKNYNP